MSRLDRKKIDRCCSLSCFQIYSPQMAEGSPTGLEFIQLQMYSAFVAMNDLDGFIIKLLTTHRSTKKASSKYTINTFFNGLNQENTSSSERNWSKRMHGS